MKIKGVGSAAICLSEQLPSKLQSQVEAPICLSEQLPSKLQSQVEAPHCFAECLRVCCILGQIVIAAGPHTVTALRLLGHSPRVNQPEVVHLAKQAHVTDSLLVCATVW